MLHAGAGLMRLRGRPALPAAETSAAAGPGIPGARPPRVSRSKPTCYFVSTRLRVNLPSGVVRRA